MRSFDLRDSTFPLPSRPALDEPLEEVRAIIERVRTGGDEALRELTRQFDGAEIDDFRVPTDEVHAASRRVSLELKEALLEMRKRITEFASNQRLIAWEEEVGGGWAGETVHPVATAGIYNPGGRASYPSSVLMCALPASVAGVRDIVLCAPPNPDGRVPDVVLAAAGLAGVREVYRVGGAQAIAAMAFGTETIPKVDVVAGPGNIFVSLAKREVAGTVAIDSVAGPTEIAILADGDADPRWVALDLIAQAEHGPHGSFLLVTWDETLASRVAKELDLALDEIEASDDLRSWLDAGAASVIVPDQTSALRFVNEFAPEHVELLFAGAEGAASAVRSAGAVFVGPYSPVVLGDYLAGSNHVLPTGGSARWASGLRTSLFQRTTSVIRHDRDSLAGALAHLEVLAQAEGLPNHSRAALARIEHH